MYPDFTVCPVHVYHHRRYSLQYLLWHSDWSGALGLLKFQVNMEETHENESLMTEVFYVSYSKHIASLVIVNSYHF